VAAYISALMLPLPVTRDLFAIDKFLGHWSIFAEKFER